MDQDEDDGLIMVMDANGANQRPLTGSPIGGEPAWSPDGTRIVFSRGQEGNKQLWGLRLATPSTVLMVSTSNGSSEHPSWKP